MPKSWTARVWQEFRADNLTRACRDVLLTLRTFRGHGGVAHPSHENPCQPRRLLRPHGAASATGCPRPWPCAMDRAARAGRLAVPARGVEPGLRPRRSTTGQKGRGGERLKTEDTCRRKKAAWEAMRLAAAALPDLLAIRREAFEARRRAAWSPVRGVSYSGD
jgi:hypothetical protein